MNYSFKAATVMISIGVLLTGCATNPYHLNGLPDNQYFTNYEQLDRTLEVTKFEGVDVFGASVYFGKHKFKEKAGIENLLGGLSASYSYNFCIKKGEKFVNISEDYLIKSFNKGFSQPSIYINENNRIIKPKMIQACKNKNDSTYSSILLAWGGVGSRNNMFSGDLYRYNTVYYSIIENDNVNKYMSYMNEKYISEIKPEEERQTKLRNIAEQERLQKEADEKARKEQAIKEKADRYAQQLAKLDKVKVYYPSLSYFPGIEGKEVEKAQELYFVAPLAFSQENPCLISSFAKSNLMINPMSSNELRHISMIELQNINPNLQLNATEYARQNMTYVERMVNESTLELYRNKFGKTFSDSYVNAGAVKQALIGMKLRCSAIK